MFEHEEGEVKLYWYLITLIHFDPLRVICIFSGTIHISLSEEVSLFSLINDFFWWFFSEFLDLFLYVWKIFFKKSKS